MSAFWEAGAQVLHDRHNPKQFAIRVRLERTERYDSS